MNPTKILMTTIVLLMTMNACKKSSTYPTNVKMTDAPGPYSAVYIDLVGVEIITSDNSTVSLNTKAGIYNLLDLSNGLDTLIATVDLGNPNVSQIRLILGANNSIVYNGTSYPLSTPSADQSGLKVQVHQTLYASAANTILLDFDADKSIVETGSGTFKLKPVIRTIEAESSGSIKGKISLTGQLAVATVTSATGVSYSSYVSSNGEFKISGLASGVYTLVVTPKLPLTPVVVSNVTVTTGVATNVGTVIL